jgi:hypothetical protein
LRGDEIDEPLNAGGAGTPPLTPLTASLFVITAIRAVLGIAAFVALLVFAGNDQALRLAFAAGVGIMTVAALYRSRTSSHYSARAHAEPLPPDARRQSWWRIAGRAAFPSTIGLVILIAIAAPIEPVLASLLAGFELGLAAMSLALGAENAYWERSAGVVIEYAPGPPARVFARPHRSRLAS